MRFGLGLFALCALGVAGCANSPPNLKSSGDYSGAPKAPPVLHPFYNPYAAYGEANATWTPPVIDRNGTVVAPIDPDVRYGRPDYEHAEWATGSGGGRSSAPPGTF